MKAAPIFALPCLLLLPSAFAQEGPGTITVEPAEIFQGGVAVLTFTGKEVAGAKVFFGDTEIIPFPIQDGSYTALAGVDLETPPGAVAISVRGRSGAGQQWERRAVASVLAKEFPREAFSVSPSFDQLDAATMKRIKREQAEFDRLWKMRTAGRLWDGGFLAPVPGDITSPFGLRRVINSLPRAPHGGVDLKAQLGMEIVAANHGRVALRDDFYFSGKSIVLDHGGGVYTMYFHLSEFRVEKHAQVRKGDVIGLAGMTGRVTGPHLHWGARLNGARVDPMELLKIAGRRQEAPPQRLADPPLAEVGSEQSAEGPSTGSGQAKGKSKNAK